MDCKGKLPHIIEQHPAADIPISGLTSHLVQAGEQQFVFMQFDADVQVAEHAHEAQWGVVLEGTMDLTVAGERRTLCKGDTYFIGKGVPHSAVIHKGYSDLTLFDQVDRYQVR